MNRVKKNNVKRIIIQALSFAFHNGYIHGWTKGNIYTGTGKVFCVPGLNCYSCPGAIGACPIGSLQAVLDSGKFKFSCYVLGFIGIVGILCGRLVCGFLCPFGFIQDLLNRIPLKKKVKNLPGHKYLRYLRYVILIVFVIVLPMTVLNVAGVGQPWFCEYICPVGTLLGGIPLTAANANLAARIGPRFIWKASLLAVILILSVLSYRPFCKYICPLGSLYGLCNKVSAYRFNVDQSKCIQCGACQKSCGMDIKVWENPNSTECIRCGKCKAVCPNGAISSTWESAVERLRKKDEIDHAPDRHFSAWKLISAIIIFLAGAAMAGGFGYLICYYTSSGMIDGMLSLIMYILLYLPAFACGVMLLIFAIRLFESCSDRSANAELRQMAFVTSAVCALIAILLPLVYELLISAFLSRDMSKLFADYFDMFKTFGLVFVSSVVLPLIALPALKNKASEPTSEDQVAKNADKICEDKKE